MKKLIYLAIAPLFLFSADGLIGERPVKIENIVYRPSELADVKEIARQVGKKILEIRESGQLVSEDVLLPNGKLVRQTNAHIV